ncbi:MAG: hypothetical protein J6Y62_01085 [Clostridia bacterium]|nr:hypothetical protein [Clostridia bacterium]
MKYNPPPPVRAEWSESLERQVREALTASAPYFKGKAGERRLAKAVRLFKIILDKAASHPDGLAYVPTERLARAVRGYRPVMTDLYNANLIYFHEGRKGGVSHGKSKSTKTYFCGCYRLSSRFLQGPRLQGPGEGCSRKRRPPESKYENLLKSRPWVEKNLHVDCSGLESMTPRQRRALYREIMAAQKMAAMGPEMQEPAYSRLTFADGTPFLCEGPREGRFPGGRRYSSLTCMPKKIRETLLLDGLPLMEIGDVKSCYMTLLASMSMEPSLIAAVLKDVYMDCIEKMGLRCARDKIKPYFQKYLLSTNQTLLRNVKRKSPSNDPAMMKAVFDYMRTFHPASHRLAMSFQNETRRMVSPSMKTKAKKTKSILRPLQIAETSLISKIRGMIPSPTLTVHDAVLSTSPAPFDFHSKIQNLLFPAYTRNARMPECPISQYPQSQNPKIPNIRKPQIPEIPNIPQNPRIPRIPSIQNQGFPPLLISPLMWLNP